MRVHITFNRNFTDGDYAKIYIPMKNLLTWLALPLLMSSCAVFAPVAHKQPAVLKKGGEAPAATVSNDARLEYVLKYKDIARKEMLRSGIPASITLAQGVLESRYGTSELVLEAKNHFGIKCELIGAAGCTKSKMMRIIPTVACENRASENMIRTWRVLKITVTS
jgi:hypothetical protein